MTSAPESAVVPVRFAKVPTSYFTTLVCVFVVGVVVSNIVATKGVLLFPGLEFDLGPLHVNGLVTDGAFWLFPFSYVIGDVISEVYGFKAMRKVVLLGFVIMAAVAGAFWITIALPAASFYPNQAALEAVIGVVPQILLASMAGFVAGELLNSYVLVAMKARTGEGTLWARLLGSTVAGELADTTIFCLIAASAIGISTSSDLLNYIVVGFVWKTLVEAVVMPVTYVTIGFIKKREPSYWGEPV